MGLDYSIIGKRIKVARNKKGYTQEYLAEKLEVSVAVLSRIERGNYKINLTRLNQICEILGVTEGEILNETSSSSKNYLNQDFYALIKNCPSEKIKLIYDITRIIVEAD